MDDDINQTNDPYQSPTDMGNDSMDLDDDQDDAMGHGHDMPMHHSDDTEDPEDDSGDDDDDDDDSSGYLEPEM